MMKHKAQEVFIRQRRGFSKENVKVTLYHHTPGLQRDLDEVLLFNGEGWRLWREGEELVFFPFKFAFFI